MLQAITFDFWNTLYKLSAHKEVASKRAWDVKEALGELGFDFSVAEISAVFKATWEKAYFYQRVYGKEIGPRGHIKEILKQIGVTLGTDAEEKVYSAYTGTLLEMPPEVNHGVSEILSLFSQRFKLAVICNTGVTPGIILRKIMARDGIIDWFDFLVFSDEVGFAKPSEKIFQYTLKNLNMGNNNAVHIGDDAITDVIGAKKAGMKAAWLAPGADWAVPEADYHIRSIRELAGLL
ncbi:MAG: HAD family hydrolase [Syntrophomonadaceae bacterium]|nr:HAD family hydrolase [Syntrophomonadaceae bacterium]